MPARGSPNMGSANQTKPVVSHADLRGDVAEWNPLAIEPRVSGESNTVG
jgi:hypothetical protein